MKFSTLAFCFTLFFLGVVSSLNAQSCECPASTNLLSNPDFSLGNVGFWSDLAFEDYCDGSSYDVGNEGRDKCDEPIWIDNTWDNTVGTSAGSYMIVNGPSYETYSVYNRIWAQSVSVEAGEAYTFYFHVLPKLTYTDSDLKLAFYVNDVNVSGNLSIPDITSWLKYCFVWTATSTGFVTPHLRQVENFASIGYDYGIDDVYFGKCEEVVEPCDVSAYWSYDITQDCFVQFNDLSTAVDGSTIVAYDWDFGDGNSSNEANPNHWYDEPGTYEVCLTIYAVNDDGECCTSKICGFVFFNCPTQPCQANIYNMVYSIFDVSDCTIQFASSSTPNRPILGYFWNFGDGETGTGPNPIHDYDGPGTYEVCVTIVLDDGEDCCSETYCKTFNFDCGFTTSGGGGNFKVEQSTPFEIEEDRNLSDQLQISPNPAKDDVLVQYTSKETQDFQLFLLDLQGKLIQSQNGTTEIGVTNIQLNVNDLPAGTYFINMVSNSHTLTKKLILN